MAIQHGFYVVFNKKMQLSELLDVLQDIWAKHFMHPHSVTLSDGRIDVQFERSGGRTNTDFFEELQAQGKIAQWGKTSAGTPADFFGE